MNRNADKKKGRGACREKIPAGTAPLLKCLSEKRLYTSSPRLYLATASWIRSLGVRMLLMEPS